VQRELNVSVAGGDDDSGFYPGGVGFHFVKSPGRTVTSFHKNEFEGATTIVGEDIYVSDMQPGGPTSIPFRLNTGDYDVAFTVEGQIHALLRAGEGYAEATRQMALAVPVKAGTARPGGKSAMAAGKEPGTGAKVRIGDDGAVWMKRYRIGRDPSQTRPLGTGGISGAWACDPDARP
jgi:hypothetical protein